MSKLKSCIIFDNSLIFDINNFDAVEIKLEDGTKYELIKKDDGSFMLLKEHIYIETILGAFEISNVDYFKPIIYNSDSCNEESDYFSV